MSMINWHIDLISDSSKYKDKHLKKIKEQVLANCTDYGLGLMDEMLSGLSVSDKTLIWKAEGYSPVGFKPFLSCFEYMYDELDIEWNSSHITDTTFMDVEGEESHETLVWWIMVMGKFTGQQRFLKLDDYGWDSTTKLVNLDPQSIPENFGDWSSELIQHLIKFNDYENEIIISHPILNDSFLLPRIIAGHPATDPMLKKSLIEQIKRDYTRTWTDQVVLLYCIYTYAWIVLGLYKKGYDEEISKILGESELGNEESQRVALRYAREDRVADENLLFWQYRNRSYELVEIFGGDDVLFGTFIQALEKLATLYDTKGERAAHFIKTFTERVDNKRVQKNPSLDDYCTIHFEISLEQSKKDILSSLNSLKEFIQTQLVPLGCEGTDSGHIYSGAEVIGPYTRFIEFIKANVIEELGECYDFEDLGIYGLLYSSLGDLEDEEIGFPQSFILLHSGSGLVDNIIVRFNLPGVHGSELSFEEKGIFVATYDLSGEYLEHRL